MEHGLWARAPSKFLQWPGSRCGGAAGALAGAGSGCTRSVRRGVRRVCEGPGGLTSVRAWTHLQGRQGGVGRGKGVWPYVGAHGDPCLQPVWLVSGGLLCKRGSSWNSLCGTQWVVTLAEEQVRTQGSLRAGSDPSWPRCRAESVGCSLARGSSALCPHRDQPQRKDSVGDAGVSAGG